MATKDLTRQAQWVQEYIRGLEVQLKDAVEELQEVKAQAKGFQGETDIHYRDGMTQYPIPAGAEVLFSFGAQVNISIRRQRTHLLIVGTHAVQICPEAANYFRVAMRE